MNIFWRIYFGHLLCDFTLQTEQLVKWKREKIIGLSAHVLIFFIIGSVLTLGDLTKFWSTKSGLVLPGWVCLFILSIIHFFLDNGRIQVIDRGGTNTDNLYLFLLDQILHLGAIYLFTSSIGIIEKWVIIGCLVIFATHFTNIFLYYFEKLSKKNNKIKVYTPEKHYSLSERLLIVFSFLPPGKWWLIGLIFLPLHLIVRKLFLSNPQENTLSVQELGVNYSLAFLCGILARIIFSLSI